MTLRSLRPNTGTATRTPVIAVLALLAIVAGLLSGCFADGGDDPPVTLPAHPLRVPSATAWAYLADDQRYSEIPAYWSEIDFRVVDVLVLGPAGIQSDGRFGIYSSPKTGDLGNRFRWIIERARTQNPAITIFVSQWWGNGAGVWGEALTPRLQTDADYAAYARSVRDFLVAWREIGGGIDGYDIDYEDNNVFDDLKPLADRIRAELTSLSTAHGRPYFFSVSPVDPTGLKRTVAAIDRVNIQTYAGGYDWVSPQQFIDAGFPPQKLLFGVCPETGCGTWSIAKAMDDYRTFALAGIHLWRLNSGNYAEELAWQRQIYGELHR